MNGRGRIRLGSSNADPIRHRWGGGDMRCGASAASHSAVGAPAGLCGNCRTYVDRHRLGACQPSRITRQEATGSSQLSSHRSTIARLGSAVHGPLDPISDQHGVWSFEPHPAVWSDRDTATACVRVRTPSFPRMLWTWFLTVCSAMQRSFAISRLDSPSSNIRKI